MAATNDPDSLPTLHTSLVGHTYPPGVPTAPSLVEAQCFYYGLPSRPRLVARSSTYIWLKPTGLEAYLCPKELSPLGYDHPLRAIWETTVGPAMVTYLDSQGVQWTSLDPVRIGFTGDLSPPAIVWMGVCPGSLSAEAGVEVATHCKGLLSAHGIDDIHIEIRESEVFCSAGPKMYKPVCTFNPTVRACEPFSTALGLPICAKLTPSIKGMGGFFISDPRYPGKLYLITARHILFPPEKNDNELYQYHNPSQPRKNVLLFGEAAIEKHTKAIESQIGSQYIIITQLECRLAAVDQMNEEDPEAERDEVGSQIEKARKAIKALEMLLVDVSRDWKEQENCVLGHVILSPPIGFGVGEEGFREDWAVVKIDASKVNATNFVGNVIDLSTALPVDKLTFWMCPHPANPSSLIYPGNRLLTFYDTIPDEEMWKPSPRTHNHDNKSCIMVIKCGYASGLTIGHLNTIRSFTRVHIQGQPGQMSKEVTILPHNTKSCPFSEPGDSGSAVIDSKGRLAGLLMGGAGVTDMFDCTYITSISFICKRMLGHGLKANLSPSLTV
ncbi:hypothetical protein V8B97DRAFT_2042554 [Scleroderma yunnanense]